AHHADMAADGARIADRHAQGLSSKVVVPIVAGVKSGTNAEPCRRTPSSLVPFVESRSVSNHCSPLRASLAWYVEVYSSTIESVESELRPIVITSSSRGSVVPAALPLVMTSTRAPTEPPADGSAPPDGVM